MKNSQFILRLLLIVFGLVALCFYLVATSKVMYVKGFIIVVSLVLIFFTTYIEINKQILYLSSSSLFDEVNIDEFLKYNKMLTKTDFLNVMNRTRVILNAFYNLHIKDYNLAIETLQSQSELFIGVDNRLIYHYLLGLVFYKKDDYKTSNKYFETVIKEKVDEKKIAINLEYINALKAIIAGKKQGLCEKLMLAKEKENTNFIKKLIDEEIITYGCQ